VSANRSFYRSFQLKPDDVVRQSLDRIAGENQPLFQAFLMKLLQGETVLEDIELVTGSGDQASRWMANGRRVEQPANGAPLLLLSLEKLTATADRTIQTANL
jgi:hypothetical protein